MGSKFSKRKNKIDESEDFTAPSKRKAVSTVYEEPEEEEAESEITLCFKPGLLGFEADRLTGDIHEVVPCSRAYLAGVQVGWRIVKVNGLAYTWEELNNYMTSASEYSLTFSDGDGTPSIGRSTGNVRSERSQEEGVDPDLVQTYMSHMSLASDEIAFAARARAELHAKKRQDANSAVPLPSERTLTTESTDDPSIYESTHRYLHESSSSSRPTSGKRKGLMVETIQEQKTIEDLAMLSPAGPKHLFPNPLNSPSGQNHLLPNPLNSSITSSPREQKSPHGRRSPMGRKGGIFDASDNWSETEPQDILPNVPMNHDPFHNLISWKLFCRTNPFVQYTQEWLEGLEPKAELWEPSEEFLEALKKDKEAEAREKELVEGEENVETEQERFERELREEGERVAAEYKASEVRRLKGLLQNSCDGWKKWLSGRNVRCELKVFNDETAPTVEESNDKSTNKKMVVVKEKRLFEVPKYRAVEETILEEREEIINGRRQTRTLPITKVKNVPYSAFIERIVKVKVAAEMESEPLRKLKVTGESWCRAPLDAHSAKVWSRGKNDTTEPDEELVCWRGDFIAQALRDAAALGLDKPVVAAETVRNWIRQDWSHLELFRWYVEVVAIDGDRYLWSPNFVSYLWEYWQRSKLGEHVCKLETEVVALARQEGTTDELFKRKPVHWPEPIKRPPRWKVPEKVISRVETPEIPELPYRLPHKELFEPDTLELNLRKHLEGTEAWDAMTGSTARLRAAGRAVIGEKVKEAFQDVIQESRLDRTRRRGRIR